MFADDDKTFGEMRTVNSNNSCTMTNTTPEPFHINTTVLRKRIVIAMSKGRHRLVKNFVHVSVTLATLYKLVNIVDYHVFDGDLSSPETFGPPPIPS